MLLSIAEKRRAAIAKRVNDVARTLSIHEYLDEIESLTTLERSPFPHIRQAAKEFLECIEKTKAQ